MPQLNHTPHPPSPTNEAHAAFGADAVRFDQGLTDAAHERGPAILLQHSVAGILGQLVALDGFDATAERMARLWDLDAALVKANMAAYLQQHAPVPAEPAPAASAPQIDAGTANHQVLVNYSVINLSEVAAAFQLPHNKLVEAADDWGYSIDTYLKCLVPRNDFLENVIDYAIDGDYFCDHEEGCENLLARVKELIPEHSYVDLAH